MRAFPVAALVFLGAVPTLADPIMPTRSFNRLVSSNGFAAVSYDRTKQRIDTFLEHPYRFRAPNNPNATDLCFSADDSRNLAYDTYFGWRATASSGGTTTQAGVWVPEMTLDGAGYLPGTGIIHTAQTWTGGTGALSSQQVHAETWNFMPMAVAEPVLLQIVKITNQGTAAIKLAPYALFNFHLGVANGGQTPDANNENSLWDATRHAFYEWGPRPPHGTMAYVAITPEAHHTTSGGNNSGYNALHNNADLDDSNSAGPTTDVVPGFEWPEVSLNPGESIVVAAGAVWALDENAAPHVDNLIQWINGRDPMALLQAEQSDWAAWHTTPPAGLSPDQQNLWKQSAAFIRMAQVKEPGSSYGQILASLPPGLGDVNSQWNITWVRDMAYAVVALARTGHLKEALDAITFQVNAGPGKHTQQAGRPYQLSATRYFGDGEEECDCNQNGPNIEFDGFGLFLWSVGEYLRAGGDPSTIQALWPTIRTGIADVLVALIDQDGVVSADSSIWEVHWNGQQRHFTYTSLAAARGLADAAAVALKLGQTDDANRYLAAAEQVRDAVVARHTDPNGVLAQSAEQLALGTGYIDASTAEAISWGVVDPHGRVAQATVGQIEQQLRVASGMGFMRNQDGAWYDSQEWVFVDLRLIPVLQAMGDATGAQALLGWIEGQALANDFHIPELLDPKAGTYEGSIPMIGFGAGAYLIARSGLVLPALAGKYGDRPQMPPADGGMDDAGAPPATDAGDGVDAGTSSPKAKGSGCQSSATGAAGAVLLSLLLGLRRRVRKS